MIWATWASILSTAEYSTWEQQINTEFQHCTRFPRETRHLKAGWLLFESFPSWKGHQFFSHLRRHLFWIQICNPSPQVFNQTYDKLIECLTYQHCVPYCIASVPGIYFTVRTEIGFCLVNSPISPYSPEAMKWSFKDSDMVTTRWSLMGVDEMSLSI